MDGAKRVISSVPGRRRARAGFTMAEMLAAMAILIVLGSVVVTMLPTAAQVVKRATYTSNSDVLASSVNTAITDVLRYANLYVDDEGTILTNPETGSPLFKPASSYVDATGSSVETAYLTCLDDRIRLVPLVGGAAQTPTPVPRSTGIYTDFKVTDFHLEFLPDQPPASGSVTGVYQGNYTLESNDGSYSKRFEFTCRPLTTETVAP